MNNTKKNAPLKIGDTEFNTGKVKELRTIVVALDSARKQKILKIIGENPGISVSDICAMRGLNTPQAHVSVILSIFKRIGIVEFKKDNRFTRYNINATRIAQIKKLLDIL